MYQRYKKCIQMYPTTPKFIKMYPNNQKSTKCTKMYSGFLLLTSITKVQLYLSIHDCCILCNPQTTRNGIHAYKRDISFQNLYCLLFEHYSTYMVLHTILLHYITCCMYFDVTIVKKALLKVGSCSSSVSSLGPWYTPLTQTSLKAGLAPPSVCAYCSDTSMYPSSSPEY